MRIFALSHRCLAASLFLISGCVAVAYSVARLATEAILMPVLSFIRDAPVSAEIAFLPKFKAIAFRILGALKPVYRDSYRTNGQSLHDLHFA